MDNSWVFDLETNLFSIVKNKVLNKLNKKFPTIHFTLTDEPKDATTKYPTVYMHEMSGSEKARTTEGHTINGIQYSMQIEFR